MCMKKPDGSAWIWDLDGTLLDSYGAITGSLAALTDEIGYALPSEKILREIKTKSVSGLLRRISEERGISYDQLWNRYREISRGRLEEITLMDGAAETLSALRDRGAVHFVYTHRGASSEPVLKRLKLLGFFTEVVTHEYGLPLKPAGDGILYLTEKYGLDPEKTRYVGDRRLDMECAANAGVRGILLCPPDSVVKPVGLEERVITSLWELTAG